MTSVWFAASGSGEDGDEYDVHEVFATQEAAQAHCDRLDRPKWEHCYVQEWEVTGSLLTDEERKAIGVALQCVESARCQKHPEELAAAVLLSRTSAALRSLLERLK